MDKPHALAFVKWNEYRRGDQDHYEPPQFFYCSGKPRIQNLVGSGGILWIVTSRRKCGKTRYSLAFKLVACYAKNPDAYKRKKYGKYMVQSRDWRHCRYYSFEHDVTAELLKLSFMHPGDAPGKIGQRIQAVQQLGASDVRRLERVEDKLVSQRMVFISYSTKDGRYADKLEIELHNRDVNTWRDLAGLRTEQGSGSGLEPGVEWELTLRQIATGTDSILVLVSQRSAQSKWVTQEVAWALNAMKKTKLVKQIIPIVLPGATIKLFPKLSRFQAVNWPANVSKQKVVFDGLAAGIKKATARIPTAETRS